MQRDLTLGKRKQPIMRSALGETLRFAEQSEKKTKQQMEMRRLMLVALL